VSADARLRLDIGDILDIPGASRTLHERLIVPGTSSSPAAEVLLDATLDSMVEGVGVHGTLTGNASTQCSRCLEPMSVTVDSELREVFLAPGDETAAGEAYEIDDFEIDLEPMLRDVIGLDIPAYPRCREDCAGLCPACGNDRNQTPCSCDTTSIDPRLAVLADLPTPEGKKTDASS
jgi:uncharacterized protein